MPLSDREKLKRYEAAQRENQRTLQRVTVSGSARMKKLYDRAQAELAGKLRREVRAGRPASYTTDRHRVVSAMLQQGQRVLTHRLTGELNAVSREAQEQGVQSATEVLGKLSRDFDAVDPILPTEEASVFQRLVDARQSSLLRQHEASMNRYGAELVTTMEDQLSLSLLQDETPLQAIDRVQSAADNQWWQGERIVRTESSWAFNLGHHDAFKEAQTEIPDLWMRWSEHVSDEDGEPLDDRVADDSLHLHAQVAPAGGRFRLPQAAAPDVSAKLMQATWEAPPNRPNDRAVLQPWRKDWGVPGYQLVGGVPVWLVPLGS